MLFTIGYQGLTVEQFLQLLKQHEINLVVDVRSKPYSHFPGFSRPQIETAIRDAGMSYTWQPKLGGKSGRRELGYEGALKTVVTLSKTRNVCVMCMEADPDKCHRKRWITADIERNYFIRATHILGHSMRWKRKAENSGPRQSRLNSVASD